MGECFAKNEVAYIPNIAALTLCSTNAEAQWEHILDTCHEVTKQQFKQGLVAVAKVLFDVIEKAHKKCATPFRYRITRDADLQSQIMRSWSDAAALLSSDRDMRHISQRIKDTDFSLPLGWEKAVADKDDVARRIAKKEGQTVYRYYEKADKAIAVSDLPADATAKKCFLKTTASNCKFIETDFFQVYKE